MTKYASILTLSSLILAALTNNSAAQTVPDNVYLNDKIRKQSQSLNYDDLTALFKDSPIYNVDCIMDERNNNASSEIQAQAQSNNSSSFLNNGKNSEESIEVFDEYLKQDPFQSVIQFKYIPMEYGFDLKADKINIDDKANPVFEFSESTACSNGLIENQDDKKNCGSLAFQTETQIIIDDQDDSYVPEAIKSEDWRAYYIS